MISNKNRDKIASKYYKFRQFLQPFWNVDTNHKDQSVPVGVRNHKRKIVRKSSLVKQNIVKKDKQRLNKGQQVRRSSI